MILAIAACCTALHGQSSGPGAGIAQTFAAMDQGRYLVAVDLAAGAAFTADGKVRDEGAFQTWAQTAPFITNELDPKTLARAGRIDVTDPAWAARLAVATPRDAIDEIVRRAKATNIVILNEAHDSPRGRAFGLEVAQALRPLGYSYLAAEAFTNDQDDGVHPTVIERLRRDRYARLSTGPLLRDPVFAGFVRKAMALGYQPLAYEQTGTQRRGQGENRDREQAQAENLITAIFRSEPHAKVLIYVGYGHIAEAPLELSGVGHFEGMALRLKRVTGIDPLTIEQANPSELTEAYAAATARIVGDRSAVFFEGTQPLVIGRYAGAVDIQVFHPRRAYAYGRPTWLKALGGKPIAIPSALLPSCGRRLIQVFAADAPDDAVPLDQVVVTAGQPPPSLMVPSVEFRYRTQP